MLLQQTLQSKCFTNDQLSALIMKRVLPSSFKGGIEDAAELVDLVEGLWIRAESYYQQALGRPPNQVECKWLVAFALDALRARQNTAYT